MIVFTVLQIVTIIIVTIPFSILATIFAQWRPTHAGYFEMARLWSKIVLWIAGVKLVVRGREKLKTKTGYVIAANHASLFDVASILAGIPENVCFVMKRELTRIPIWGWALLRSPYIVVKRGKMVDAKRSMNEAADRLREVNRTVAFFPEGTRTRTGKMRPFKRGAFVASMMTGVPVVPVTINGSFNILPKGKFRINRGTIEMIIEDPVSPVGLTEQSLMERVEAVIKRNYVEQN